jgi:hypothetical protein
MRALRKARCILRGYWAREHAKEAAPWPLRKHGKRAGLIDPRPFA